MLKGSKKEELPVATIMNLNDKGFDYLCALNDVSSMIAQHRERGISSDESLEILTLLGNAASARFNNMLEDLHRRCNGTGSEKKAGSDVPRT